MSPDSPRRAGPGRPRDLVRRRELLDVASETFAELGYGGTSLGELARRCHLTKAALVHRFASKENLYLQVLAVAVQELGALVLTAGAAAEDFATRLARLGDTVTHYFGAHPAAAKLVLSELVGRGPYGQGELGSTQVLAALRAAETFLAAGMDAGEFERRCPRQLTMSIVGVHLVYFAASEVTHAFVQADPFDPAALSQRASIVREQIAAMVLASPKASRVPARRSREPTR